VALILVVGPDAAVLEGLSQTLVGAGHHVHLAGDISEAILGLGDSRPMVAVIDSDELMRGGLGLRGSLAAGGAIIAFHCDEADAIRLPFELRRATLAELQLPLERQRLLALVKFVDSRARTARKDPQDDALDPELRA
jgi:DNA-binding NtrC family response regulator